MNIMKKQINGFIFLTIFLVSIFYFPNFSVQAQDLGFPEAPEIALINKSKFWNIFNNNSEWNLEYFNGLSWISIKSDLKIIKDYKGYTVFPNGTMGLMSVNKSQSLLCKITLNFTSSHTANYRLTFGINLEVKNYTYNNGFFNYTISYANYTVNFDWNDLKNISDLKITHGIKLISNIKYFWFRIQKDNVQSGKNLIIDPIFGYATKGAVEWNMQANTYGFGSQFPCTSTGTTIGIAVYIKQYLVGLNAEIICALYKHSDSSLVGITEKFTIPDGWNNWVAVNFIIPKPPVFISTDYVIMFRYSMQCYAYTSAYPDFVNQGNRIRSVYPTYSDPEVFVHQQYKWSIYCAYTAGTAKMYKNLNQPTITIQTIDIRKRIFNNFPQVTTVTQTSDFYKRFYFDFNQFTQVIQIIETMISVVSGYTSLEYMLAFCLIVGLIAVFVMRRKIKIG